MVQQRAPLLALAAALPLLAACGPRRTVVVALDEAFAEARPGLAAELSAGPGAGYRVDALTVRLSDGPGRVLEELERSRKAGERPAALVASPLVAASLPGPWRRAGDEASALGEALLLAPEWRAPEAAPGSGRSWATAATDPVPAYARAGAAAGSYIASLGAGGPGAGSPACAILFLSSASRPRDALEAFAAAYGQTSGGARLLVREQPEPAESAEAQAEAAVRELLDADIRLLFVALGQGTPAAIRAAARPGLVVGADAPIPETPPGLTFRLRPDDRALARALWAALPGKGGAGGGRGAVPALLEALPAGGDPAKAAFGARLREIGETRARAP